MFQNAHPKCANPFCPTAFDWMKGGKFFRFPREEALESKQQQADLAPNVHNVEHFWLCKRCSQMFTLVYAKGQGVVLRALIQDLPSNPRSNSHDVKAA